MTDGQIGGAPLPPETEAVVRYATEHPELFKQIQEQVADRELTKLQRVGSTEYQSLLADRFESFKSERNFDVGEFVEWIPGLRNKTRPKYNEPAIVLEIRERPHFDDRKDPGSAYYMERLDLVLGVLDSDDEFVVYHFDSRRFCKYESAVSLPPRD